MESCNGGSNGNVGGGGGKSKHIPERMCAGCRQKANKNELIRIVNNSGEMKPDPSGKLSGRGVYLHKNPDCLKTALKKRSLERNLRIKTGKVNKAEAPDSIYAALEELINE